VEIEIRQDLLAEEAGRQAWVKRLIEALQEAERGYFREESEYQPVGKQAR
jgi:predicted N-formylglutamate amidohydrolase